MTAKGSSEQSGYSLLELVCALAVLALLSSLLMPTITQWMENARTDETRGELEALAGSCIRYYRDTGVFPATLASLVRNNPSVTGWQGPYHSSGPNTSDAGVAEYAQDAWGQNYLIENVDAFSKRLRSPGLDGYIDTGDDILIEYNVHEVARDVTDRELAAINEAIEEYNENLLTTHGALSTTYSNLLASLVTSGLLRNTGSVYDTDGWGRAYVTGSAPVQSVSSQGTPGGGF